MTALWNVAKGLRHAVALRQRLLGPRRPSWDATYETLATVLHAYAQMSTRLSVAAQRRAASGFFEQTDVVKATRCDEVDADGVPAEWFHVDGEQPGRLLYYLHGGGYVIGSIDSHRDLIARLCRACGARGFAIDYRLAPENPFPAQLEDALRAYRWLLGQGVEPSKLLIAGESAGGGLTLSTLVALRDEGLELPAAAVVISPWIDLEGLGASAVANAPFDFINRPVLESFASRFVTPAQRRDPRAAPLYADLSGLPPLLVQAGAAEALLDDATRLAERAAQAGVEVELDVWDDMIHAWHAFAPLVAQGRAAIDAVGVFARRQLDA